MKRRLGLLAAAAVIATVGFIAPSSPASAHPDLCVGTGTATLSTGLGLPGTVNSASFTFSFTAGVCVSLGGVTATGTVTGACGLSTGSGTVNGHAFGFTSTGTVLVLTGPGAVGVVSAAEDPTDSGSCLTKTARNFLVTGEVVTL